MTTIKELKQEFYNLTGIDTKFDDVLLYAHEHGLVNELMATEGAKLTARHKRFWENAVSVAKKEIQESEADLDQVNENEVEVELVILKATKNTTLEVNDPVTEPPTFNQATTPILPMRLGLWTLAIVIVPAVIVLGWVGNGLIKLVKITIPLMDKVTTLVFRRYCMVNRATIW